MTTLDKLSTSQLKTRNNKMLVTVWTTPQCAQCMMTKRKMDTLGIKYEEKSLVDNPEQLEQFKEQGYTSAPIVTTDVKIWSGFRLEKIESLGNYLRSQERGNNA